MSEDESSAPQASARDNVQEIVREWQWRLTLRHAVFAVILLAALALVLLRLPSETRESLLRGLFAQRTLVVLLLVFGFTMLSLLWAAGQRIDAWIFLFVNLRGERTPYLDRIMHALTQLGNAVTAFGAAVIFYLLDQPRLSLMIGLGVLTLWLVIELVKALTDRTRPFKLYSQTRIIGWRAIGRSFPSGHTAQAFFLASLLARHFHPVLQVSIGLYGLATLVAFSRVYIGMHFPRDVLAGAMLGTVWGILAILLEPYISGRIF